MRIRVPSLLLGLLSCLPAALAAETRPPNIILLLTDDQGYHDLSC